MQSVDIVSAKKCAICRYWYDPTNSAINPKAPQINLWELDESASRMCLQRGIFVRATDICGRYSCKLEVI